MSKIVTKTKILVRPAPGGTTVQTEVTTIRTDEVFVTLGHAAVILPPDGEVNTTEPKDMYGDPDKDHKDGEAKPPQDG